MKASEYVDIGQYLHDSRESLHVTVEQAAQALHIRPKYLRAIETGNLSDLPGKAYIRGYIRNYAEFMGLNSVEVLEAYESLLAHKGQDFFVPEPTLKQNLPSRRLIRGALIGMAALYGYWYFVDHDSTTLPADTSEMPYEFVQILHKSSREGMDKAWENCMDSFGTGCFIELRRQSALPERMYHDALYRNIPSKKP